MHRGPRQIGEYCGMKYVRALIYCCLSLSVLILTHCGFQPHPLGQLPSTLQPLYIETNHPYGALNKTLQREFHSLHIPLAPTATEAAMTLHIVNEGFSSGALAESENSKVKQYWLSYRMVYQLKNKKNHVIQTPRSIFVERTYTVNEDQVLGATGETAFLRQVMMRDAVYRLLGELQSLHTQQVSKEQKPHDH